MFGGQKDYESQNAVLKSACAERKVVGCKLKKSSNSNFKTVQKGSDCKKDCFN